ncbi:hypothetical protein VHA01S_031_00570 [Vibrio halioticoli NBRC 102217]|uniref:Uncharacterized protein n=1 Tax=Vibrio halioticoli NBRC 102217 TaxID=1219072 RepID=V5HLH4_9VIBR|nr:hypothetical protein VHA01S_031_00570 [Vibrio halioticoli NBRC 102217]
MISLDEVSFSRLECGKITKFDRAKLRFSTLAQDLKKIEKLLCPLNSEDHPYHVWTEDVVCDTQFN